MSPEKQRIAIAEACGWTNCYVNTSGFLMGFSPKEAYRDLLPDYLNDLNEMNDAEGILSEDQWWPRYYDNLADVVGGTYYQRCIVSATAAQRAEALLKTLGKWEESS